MFMYEAPEDGGGAPPAEADGGGWQPTQEWGQRIDQFIESAGPVLGQLNEVLSQPDDGYYGQPPMQQPYGDPYGGQPLYDPYTGQPLEPQQPTGFDPQAFDQAVQQAVEARMGPYTPLLTSLAEREGEQAARTMLADMKATTGDFNDDHAIMLTRAFMAQGADPQQALNQAAAYAAQIRKEERAAAVEEYRQQLGAAADASGRQQPGAGGAALEVPTTPTGRDRYEQVLSRFESGLAPVTPERI